MSESTNLDSSDTPPTQEISARPNTSVASTSMPQRRCLVISLVRHAECDGNVSESSWPEDDGPSPLTEVGLLQAESLGKDWVDTRIDHLLSSPLERAHDTAKALSYHNESNPQVVVHPSLVERRFGRRVVRLMREDDVRGAQRELTGTSIYSKEPISRLYSPSEGGESLDNVALRAEGIVRSILSSHGVSLSEPPEFFVNKKTTKAPADLPDGIPHVVIVSHNILLIELYEKLRSWGGDHSVTDCEYMNASWSRHILWYDEGLDKLDVFDMKYCKGHGWY